MGDLKGKVVEVRPFTDTDATRKIGEFLKKMRKLSGLTQAQMAKRLKVVQASISKIEAGHADMQVSTIQRYVNALGGKLQVNASLSADNPLSLHIRDEFKVAMDSEDQFILPIFAGEAFRPHRDVVLSIRPKYTTRIMSGEKTVELRRRFPALAQEGTIAYIYSTSPERAMVGFAKIAGVRKLDVEEIWRCYANVAFIERPDFDRYFKGMEQGFALKFADVRPFVNPLSLSDLRRRFDFEPPQSFLYAKQDLREALSHECTVVSH